MNNAALAQSAYGVSQAPVRSERSIEYQAFAKVTHGLIAVEREMDITPKVVEAVHDNRRLWTILAVDVASEHNQLPSALRAGIFSLNQFVTQHSKEVLKGQEDVSGLIEINRTVMRGLSDDVGQG